LPQILILLSADKDLPLTEDGQTLLKDFRVAYQLRVGSGAVAPDYARDLITSFQKAGGEVIVCVTTAEDPLAILAAAWSTRPVLRVLAEGSQLSASGPAPVATLGLGATGFAQAMLFALQILAVKDEALALDLQRYRQSLATRSIASDQKHRVDFHG
jgi:5-(carboxyamino)imidazole ribonucleotide mutase